MFVLYYRVSARIIQINEGNHIRPGHTMVFWELICPVWDSKIIVVDVDAMFVGIFNKTFQETLPITLHAFLRGNHMVIINERSHRYLSKVQKIISADKDILPQWLQGVLKIIILECRPSRQN